MIVVDASVVAPAIGDCGDSGRAARDLLAGESVCAPDLVDVETVSVLRRRWLGGDLSVERFMAAIDDLADLPIVRFPGRPLLQRVGALRAAITPYDALYVALAELLSVPLVTADGRLASAPGIHCEVRLIE